MQLLSCDERSPEWVRRPVCWSWGRGGAPEYFGSRCSLSSQWLSELYLLHCVSLRYLLLWYNCWIRFVFQWSTRSFIKLKRRILFIYLSTVWRQERFSLHVKETVPLFPLWFSLYFKLVKLRLFPQFVSEKLVIEGHENFLSFSSHSSTNPAVVT